MSKSSSEWTGNLNPENQGQIQVILEQLCMAFNASPFFRHNNMQMRIVDEQIQAYIEMEPYLIGNVAFQILHGGVAATILDSIGGIVAMGELYKRAKPEEFADTVKKVSRLATLDMRIDYIAPGRGEYFIASADILRLGRKSCTMRMNLTNNENQLIATAIGSYSF
ncbi:thioesterase family protein [Acinetobacter puyangensis]|uniref:thioesterase family protein n=1 Tax=Acinetobacter puyangensis TaxID=1096779 RepID=UPI003A4E239E